MKKEDLFEALKDIDPESVKEARNYHGKKKFGAKRWIAVAACFAVCVGAIFYGPTIGSNTGNSSVGNKNSTSGILTVLAAYPEPVAPDMDTFEFSTNDEYWDWWEAYREQISKSQPLQTGMAEYNLAMMNELLVTDSENTVCSPLNTYIALSMLAEVSDGKTRQQILDLLGVEDVETLRDNISNLWNSNYVDTPAMKSVLANSIWLNNQVQYKDETLNTLANNYYASSFRGEMGTEDMNKALRKWTDDNTCGLLSDYSKDLSTDSDTVLEILSTIYYKAMWSEVFEKDSNAKEIFHGVLGDTTVDMMKKTSTRSVYCTDDFISTSLNLNDSGSMYFILPQEGVDVNALPSNPDIFNAIEFNGSGENWIDSIEVNMSIPKFKVQNKVDLLAAIQKLGVTDASNAKRADFSPLSSEADSIFVSKAEHAAMLEIDEEGVTGAAYTDLQLDGCGMPAEEEIDFVLDRPFMFIVTGADGSILFSGIIRNI